MPDQNTSQEPSGLTLQDLLLVAQIIQLSSAKGVFRAEDLLQIGSLYNRLIGFLENTGAITRGAPAEVQSQQDDASSAVDDPATEEATAKEKKNAKARR